MRHHFVGGRFRVGGAILLGVCIVIGAYFLRGDATASPNLDDPSTFVAAKPLREYQDTKDTDGDGLRDWFEELTGTDPLTSDANDPHSARVTPTSTPFVADTETKKFAVAFFDEVLKANKTKGLSEEEKQRIYSDSLGRFVRLNDIEFITRNDITIDSSGDTTDVHAYGNEMGLAILNNNTRSREVPTEAVTLGRALEDNDPTLLQDLDPIIENYDGMLEDMRTITVPRDAIDAHLALVNAITAVRNDIAGFKKTFEDPLVGFMYFKRYRNDGPALAQAIESMRRVLEQQGIIYGKEEPGSFFFSLRP